MATYLHLYENYNDFAKDYYSTTDYVIVVQNQISEKTYHNHSYYDDFDFDGNICAVWMFYNMEDESDILYFDSPYPGYHEMPLVMEEQNGKLQPIYDSNQGNFVYDTNQIITSAQEVEIPAANYSEPWVSFVIGDTVQYNKENNYYPGE